MPALIQVRHAIGSLCIGSVGIEFADHTVYRKNGPLAITDANLLLGRLVPKYFPQIFGDSEKEPLDVKASESAFDQLCEEINSESADKKSRDEIAYGFLKIANETMCRPIRALTEARGYDTTKHVLASFGGASGQHCCAIAKSLGISKVLVHRFSSVLSAYGMALADRHVTSLLQEAPVLTMGV